MPTLRQGTVLRLFALLALSAIAVWLFVADYSDLGPPPGAATYRNQPYRKSANEIWDAYLKELHRAEHIPDPVQRCLAYPDLPGNRWTRGAARSACLSLRKINHQPALKDIAAALDRSEGPAWLEKQYVAILQAHFAEGTDRREPLFSAFSDFGTDEGKRVAKVWLERSPHSAYAMLAAGEGWVVSAAKIRGSNQIPETTSQTAAVSGSCPKRFHCCDRPLRSSRG